ncbi:MAG: alkaline phosphatase family protein [Candidatus Thorarchaeota archaeon SMTZ1-45]
MQTRPDYSRSIVNLMSSIGSASGVNSPYPPLDSLDSLKESKNIVLIILDGLGFNYLRKHGNGTTLQKNLKGSITSVFPPSTGSAITSFLSGLPPQQHGVIGWYVHLKEYGLVSRILPYTNAIDGNVIDAPISRVIDVKSILSDINREYSMIYDYQIVDSEYTRNLAGSARRIGYSDIDSFFSSIRSAITKSKKQSYVYSYWPTLDSISHFLGCESHEAKKHLIEFDEMLYSFIETLTDSDTTLVITADHGFNDVPPENIVYTRDHPKLEECLHLPVCGDTRTGFCYVRPSKVSEFERYIKNDLGDICNLHTSKELVHENWFGFHDPHPRLLDRVGDYTLTFNEGFALLNCFPGFEPPELSGHHGGVSSDEMNVPLIIIDC